MARLQVFRRLRLRHLVVDALIAVAFAAFNIVSAIGLQLDLAAVGRSWPVVIILLAGTLPLALRRVAPVVPVIAVMGSAFALQRYHYEWGALQPAILLALYSMGAHARSQRESLAGLATAFVAIALLSLDSETPGDLWNLLVFGFLGGIWLVGDTLRRRAAQIAELQRRGARLEQERELESRRAVTEERARIARELHDVVAHSVSIMVVQAAAARKVLESQPQTALISLEAIETTGRQALAEMRRLLGVMNRDDARAIAKAPQPGLNRVAALVEEMRRAGLPVDLQVEGEPGPLPPGVDLSAYRVVQEALTNALRHADAAWVSVVVRYRSDDVEVEVTDDGQGLVDDPASAGGHGLVGMRERVTLFQGEFEAGPRNGGGFVVRARLPIGAPGG